MDVGAEARRLPAYRIENQMPRILRVAVVGIAFAVIPALYSATGASASGLRPAQVTYTGALTSGLLPVGGQGGGGRYWTDPTLKP